MSDLKSRIAECSLYGGNLCKSHGGGIHEKGLSRRHITSKMTRDELEDRFIGLCENNIALKKFVNIQNEKLKVLGTKLLRLTNQQKKESPLSGPSFNLYGTMEDILKQQGQRIEELETVNRALKRNILLLQMQAPSDSPALNNNVNPATNVSEAGKSDNPRNDDINNENKNVYNLDYISSTSETENPSTRLDKKYAKVSYSYSEKDEDEYRELDSLKNDLQKQKALVQEIGLKYKNALWMLKESKRALETINKNPEPKNEDTKNSSCSNQAVQTDSDDISKKYFNHINDVLSQQLAEEQLLFQDLKRQLTGAKLAKGVFHELKASLSKLNNKIIDVKKHSDGKCDDNMEQVVDRLRKDLKSSNFLSENLREINHQLNSQINVMQRELDSLRKQSQESAKNNVYVKKDGKPIPEETKHEEAGEAIQESSDPESVNDQSVTSVKQEESDSSNKTYTKVLSVGKEVSASKKPGNVKTSVQDNEASVRAVGGDARLADTQADAKETQHQTISGIDEKGNGRHKKAVNKDVEEVKPVREIEQLVVDDGTYDISDNNTMSEISDTLSNGEVPKGRVVHRKSAKKTATGSSENHHRSPMVETHIAELPFDGPRSTIEEGEIVAKEWCPALPTKTMSELTLKAITKEIAQCETLLNMREKKQARKNASQMPAVESYDKNETKMAAAQMEIGQKPLIKPSLSYDQDTFVLHIAIVELNEDTMRGLNYGPYFLTWQFHEQFIAYTPMRTLPTSSFNFTSAYTVSMDRDLYQYFKNEKILVEIHKAVKEISQVFAFCSIDLANVLYKSSEKVESVIPLMSSLGADPSTKAGAVCGVLRCWCQLNCDASTLQDLENASLDTQQNLENKGNQFLEPNLGHNIKDSVLSRVAVNMNNGKMVSKEVVNDKSEPEVLESHRPADLRPSTLKPIALDLISVKSSTQASAAQSSLQTTTLSEYSSHHSSHYEAPDYPLQRNTIPVMSDADTISFTLLSFSATEGSGICRNADIEDLFVGFGFLGYVGQDMESSTRRKPKALGEKVHFDFSRSFSVDHEGNPIDNLKILDMLSTHSTPAERIVIITVMGKNNQEASTEDLGTAEVNMVDLLSDHSHADACTLDLEVLSVEDKQRIGTLQVRIDGLNVMRKCRGDSARLYDD